MTAGSQRRPLVAAPSALIVVVAVAGVAVHLLLRSLTGVRADIREWPLFVVLAVGGAPLVLGLARKAWRRQFGSDLLAGISIVAATLLHEYLAGAIVVLMLAGGETLEAMAGRRASAALEALSRRMPLIAHRKRGGGVEDVTLDAIDVGDEVAVYPHEICPVDGVVLDGRSVMDESYLTGEPFMMPKAPGSTALSGAINGEGRLTLRATHRAVDSRYERIVAVMRDSEQRRTALRRLGDQLGAWYTPLALVIAVAAGTWSGDPVRFLSVLVVATPCPLLIGIPVAVVGAISLSAGRGIIIRDPAVLEQVDRCRTVILDKTGTLTYGAPSLTEQLVAPGVDARQVLQLVASLERYSKHPLATPVVQAAEALDVPLLDAAAVSERPGEGLTGTVSAQVVRVIGRRQAEPMGITGQLPPGQSGLECIVLVDGAYAATYRFHDAPREDGTPFIRHLARRHHLERILIVSGDRESEVRYLAERVGITEIHAGCSPEDKVAITRRESAQAPTLFVGDGINDAPALVTATVGVAFGQRSEITTEAAGAVILDSSLTRLDELFHIARRMRRIALQSAVGGMALSVGGMLIACTGTLPPVAGAVVQEVIDVVAVLNAVRAAYPGGALSDY